MTLEEIKQWLEANKDSEDVKAYLAGLKGKAEVTEDKVKEFLGTDEGKKFIRSAADSMINQGIETFKKGKMLDLIKEEVDKRIKELNPDESPEQKLIREANDRISILENSAKKERLEKVVLHTLAAKKLTALNGLMNVLTGSDEEETLANVTRLETAIKEIVAEKVKGEFNTRDPKETNITSDPDFKNPFTKKYENLTEQGKIYKENPEKAAELQKAAAASGL